MTLCSQTLLSLIVAQEHLGVDELRERIVPLAIELNIAGGEWIDHLQELLDRELVIRVPSVAARGYVYRATRQGVQTFAAYLRVERRASSV